MIRFILSFLLTGLLGACTPHDTDELAARIRRIVDGADARIGVAVILDGRDTLSVGAADDYPLMSVVKLHQAMAVVACCEERQLSLSTELRVPAEALPSDTWSPLRDACPEGGSFTVAELLRYTLCWSDNNVCDLLFEQFGSPEAVERYVRSLHVGPCRIAVNEAQMHADLANCYRNRTSPMAAARLLERLLTDDDLFTFEHVEFLRRTLLDCRTGADRLAAPLAGTQARIGHKTGTGDRLPNGRAIACNDVGFVLLPDGRHYTIAFLMCDSAESDAENARLAAAVSRAVYRYMTERR